MASQILCREPTPPIDDMFGYPTPPCDLQEFTGETPSRGSTASLGDVMACEAGAPITGTNTPPPQRIPFNRLKYWYATVMPTFGLPTEPSSSPDLDPNWVILFQDLEAIASTDTDADQMFDYSEDESYIDQNPTDDFTASMALDECSFPNDTSSEEDFQTGQQIHLWKYTNLEMGSQNPVAVEVNETEQEKILLDIEQRKEDISFDLPGDFEEIMPRPRDCQGNLL